MNKPASAPGGPAASNARFPLLFVGGGNMASAIIGGLIKSGCRPADITVLDPSELQRARLAESFGVQVQGAPTAALAQARTLVWAVKPQQFKEAAAQLCAATGALAGALHFSVMAGLRTPDIARAVGGAHVVRAMPNTPSLIGQGISGLYAAPSVSAEERSAVAALLAPTGALVWVDEEARLDAVTALSGSGPAYVFYFIEAMVQAAQEMGLSAAEGLQLATATFAGATALASQSAEAPAVLRERVTSKGGTTHAALTHLEERGVKQAFIEALHRARQRAAELGDEFGR